jgi:Pyruvate/2-oxoacid:ferredoxin oxidoreductase gamma subunit
MIRQVRISHTFRHHRSKPEAVDVVLTIDEAALTRYLGALAFAGRVQTATHLGGSISVELIKVHHDEQ